MNCLACGVTCWLCIFYSGGSKLFLVHVLIEHVHVFSHLTSMWLPTLPALVPVSCDAARATNGMRWCWSAPECSSSCRPGLAHYRHCRPQGAHHSSSSSRSSLLSPMRGTARCAGCWLVSCSAPDRAGVQHQPGPSDTAWQGHSQNLLGALDPTHGKA